MAAKIVKAIKESGKEVLAVCIDDISCHDVLTIDGRTFGKGFFKELKPARNVSPEARAGLAAMKKAYMKQLKLQTELQKVSSELKSKIIEAQKEQINLSKAVREKLGILTFEEFEYEFRRALPPKLAERMDNAEFYVKEPLGIGYDENSLYISKSKMLHKYFRNASFLYEEYDGTVFMTDNAEQDKNYKKILKENSCRLDLKKCKFFECLSMGDKDSLWYTACYEIPLKKELTKEYARELAQMVTK